MYITIIDKTDHESGKESLYGGKDIILLYSQKIKIIDTHHVSYFHTPTVWHASKYS